MALHFAACDSRQSRLKLKLAIRDFKFRLIHEFVLSITNSCGISPIPQMSQFHARLKFLPSQSSVRVTIDKRRIESNAFRHSSLQSIVIPRIVQFIDGVAFSGVRSTSISIETGNQRLSIRDG
jgi:hypothetical protein